MNMSDSGEGSTSNDTTPSDAESSSTSDSNIKVENIWTNKRLSLQIYTKPNGSPFKSHKKVEQIQTKLYFKEKTFVFVNKLEYLTKKNYKTQPFFIFKSKNYDDSSPPIDFDPDGYESANSDSDSFGTGNSGSEYET